MADADGRRAAYARHLIALAGREVSVAAGAALSLTTGERAEPEHDDWPACVPSTEPAGAALNLLDRSIAAGAIVIGIGPFTNLALYETSRPGRLPAPVRPTAPGGAGRTLPLCPTTCSTSSTTRRPVRWRSAGPA